MTLETTLAAMRRVYATEVRTHASIPDTLGALPCAIVTPERGRVKVGGEQLWIHAIRGTVYVQERGEANLPVGVNEAVPYVHRITDAFAKASSLAAYVLAGEVPVERCVVTDYEIGTAVFGAEQYVSVSHVFDVKEKTSVGASG